MTDKQIKEDIKEEIKYFKQCKKLQLSIVTHLKYEYFSNHLTDLEESILRIVGNCNSYKDLPNFNVLQMLEQIKKRMLSYDR
mgnify:CR=1 FL=1